MVRIVLAAMLLSVPAWAEGPGSYGVEGVSPDGERYAGTAVLASTGQGLWKMSWVIGKYRYTGYGVGDGHVLAISYAGGGQSGVASYVAGPDGSYVGTWTMQGGTMQRGRCRGVPPGRRRLIPR